MNSVIEGRIILVRHSRVHHNNIVLVVVVKILYIVSDCLTREALWILTEYLPGVHVV